MAAHRDEVWPDAELALALFCVDPIGTGGVVLRSRPGPLRDHWLDGLRSSLASGAPLLRVPLHVARTRLIGGLDLATTLALGRPVAEKGLLAEANGGAIVLAMSERIEPEVAAILTQIIDTGVIRLEREGLKDTIQTSFGVVAIDEGLTPDERPPEGLADRLAFHLDFERIAAGASLDLPPCDFSSAAIEAARGRQPSVEVSDESIRSLCEIAVVLGIDSLRPPQLALAVAKANAAWEGRLRVEEGDVAVAMRLVLLPRATRIPQSQEEALEEPEESEEQVQEESKERSETPEEDPQNADSNPEEEAADEQVDDRADPQVPPRNEDVGDPEADAPHAEQVEQLEQLIETAIANMPADVLARLGAAAEAETARTAGGASGRRGRLLESSRRGRPIGSRAGSPVSGARLDLLATLRAAAPWQKLRAQPVGAVPEESETVKRAGASTKVSAHAKAARAKGAKSVGTPAPARVQVRKSDFRVKRFKQRSETTTIFAVDASGSTALNRLAEAKGAVETILAESYARRDSVALIAFRANSAELLLPATRSLVAAKRRLARLPGGGGTPLAEGIDLATELALKVQREGGTPMVVLLTDGQGNVARDGTPGRAQAMEDARAAARRFRAIAVAGLLVDTSPRSREPAQSLAAEMGARYLLLPHARSEALVRAARSATPETPPARARAEHV